MRGYSTTDTTSNFTNKTNINDTTIGKNLNMAEMGVGGGGGSGISRLTAETNAASNISSNKADLRSNNQDKI